MNDSTAKTSGSDVLEPYRNYLRALAVAQLATRLKSKVDSSDIVQQTMLKAHLALDRAPLENPNALAAWLREILANEIADTFKRYRAGKRDVDLERSIAADLDRSSSGLEAWLACDVSTPSHILEKREALSSLSDALLQLPEDMREIIVLKHLQGQSLAQVVEATGRTPASVAGLLRRGLAKLRELMAS